MEVKLYTERGELVANSAHSCLIARSEKAGARDLKKGAAL
jgi:hypothetical protein